MKYYTFLLLLVATLVQSDVYRSVDEYGNVIFSDTSSENAEKVELQEASSYTAPVIIDLPDNEVQPSPLLDLPIPNYTVVISSPSQNETIRENSGNVIIGSTISPELNGERGDKLMFILDGNLKSSMQSGNSYTFTNVDRGSHIAKVSVVDKSGKPIKSSKSVFFHLQRATVRRPATH